MTLAGVLRAVEGLRVTKAQRMSNLEVIVIDAADQLSAVANPLFISAMKAHLAKHCVQDSNRAE